MAQTAGRTAFLDFPAPPGKGQFMDAEDDSTPWLRDMVEEDLLDLFSDEATVLQDAVRRLIARAPDDPDLELRLIDLLDAAVEHENDDSSASLCATIVLAEIRSTRAIATLVRSLSRDFDEALQEAAGVALLRIGSPGLEGLMEAIEESEGRELAAPGYMLLGKSGVLEDGALRRKVLDFLEARTALEDARPPADSALTELFLATAYLGDRSRIPFLKSWLAARPAGSEPGAQDAAELLEENEAGTPIVGDLAPWEESYGWLFGDDRDDARVARPGGEGDASGDEDEDGEDKLDEKDLSFLYRGLHGRPAEGNADADGAEDEAEEAEEDAQDAGRDGGADSTRS